eukprot:m.111001 g.111001  ORF g.111001 m.111001 type:complete len:357 (-) comp21347_c0_seq2:407-1477(-)
MAVVLRRVPINQSPVVPLTPKQAFSLTLVPNQPVHFGRGKGCIRTDGPGVQATLTLAAEDGVLTVVFRGINEVYGLRVITPGVDGGPGTFIALRNVGDRCQLTLGQNLVFTRHGARGTSFTVTAEDLETPATALAAAASKPPVESPVQTVATAAESNPSQPSPKRRNVDNSVDPAGAAAAATQLVGAPTTGSAAPDDGLVADLRARVQPFLGDSTTTPWLRPGEDVTAVMAAVLLDDLDAISALVTTHGHAVDAGVGVAGRTAAWVAADTNKPECLTRLLSVGADLGKPDARGFTPIFSAATRGHEACVRVLLEAGVDPTRPPNVGMFSRTPLQTAEDNAHSECADLLRAHGSLSS